MNKIIFTGYIAEVITLRAERAEVSPEDYILSFFVNRCIAPDDDSPQHENSCVQKVQCT